jgi:superfamily I DNA/RNA helicase
MCQRVLEFLRCDEAAYGPPEAPQPGTESSALLLGGARVWTFSELHHWLTVLTAKGLVQDGAKAFVETMADAETKYSQHVLGIADIEAIFTPKAADFLTEMVKRSVPTKRALGWFRTHLLASKARAAQFPVEVARHRGPATLKERPRLFVGTIHSFKGAEADTVFIFPDLSPRGWAEWSAPGEGRDSVYRMFYVALTRARERVYLCEASTPQNVKLWALVNR